MACFPGGDSDSDLLAINSAGGGYGIVPGNSSIMIATLHQVFSSKSNYQIVDEGEVLTIGAGGVHPRGCPVFTTRYSSLRNKAK